MDDSTKVLKVMQLQRQEAKAERVIVFSSVLAVFFASSSIGAYFCLREIVNNGQGVGAFVLLILFGLIFFLEVILVAVRVAQAFDANLNRRYYAYQLDILLGISSSTEESVESDTETAN